MAFVHAIIIVACLLVIIWIIRTIRLANKSKANRLALPGKVVVITGASGGIGEALAHVFYRAGCRLVLAARREHELERVCHELLDLRLTGIETYRPEIVPLDLGDVKTLPAKASKILSKFGHVDILINNGGISVRTDILSAKNEVDVRVMTVNYLGTVALTKSILPSMVKRNQGTIVCVSSVMGKISIPYRSSYTASKHALQAFCDCLRAEVYSYGVKVLVVSPGYVATDVSRNALIGDGSTHNQMDPETASGETPPQYANKVFEAILRGDYELTPFPYPLIVWLRVTFPWLYNFLMIRRADRLASRYRSNFQHV